MSFTRVFPERCQIDAKSSSVETISAASTDSMGDQPGLFPPGSAFIGDDFMRTMISFELFGGDFTHEAGEYSDKLICIELLELGRCCY